MLLDCVLTAFRPLFAKIFARSREASLNADSSLSDSASSCRQTKEAFLITADVVVAPTQLILLYTGTCRGHLQDIHGRHSWASRLRPITGMTD